MQVLVLAAPCNGVGQTTLAQRLAGQAKRTGARPVVLLDAGPRGDLASRYAYKARPDLIIVPWDESCSGPEFGRLKAQPGGMIIVDAPLPEQPKALGETLSIADLVAVVVRPREDDFAQLGDLLEMIRAAEKPFVFLVNLAKRHGNMAAATAIALAQHGTVCPVILPEDERIVPSLRARVFRRPKRSDAQVKREQVWAYLSGQLAALQAEHSAGEAGPGEQPERRQFARQSYDIGATFTWERQVFACRIQNVSPGGLAFIAETFVPVGSRLKLHIPYLGEFDAVATHRAGDVVGLRFIIDEWEQAGLVRDLTGLVGAGGRPARASGGGRRSRQGARGEASGDRGRGSQNKKRA